MRGNAPVRIVAYWVAGIMLEPSSTLTTWRGHHGAISAHRHRPDLPWRDPSAKRRDSHQARTPPRSISLACAPRGVVHRASDIAAAVRPAREHHEIAAWTEKRLSACMERRALLTTAPAHRRSEASATSEFRSAATAPAQSVPGSCFRLDPTAEPDCSVYRNTVGSTPISKEANGDARQHAGTCYHHAVRHASGARHPGSSGACQRHRSGHRQRPNHPAFINGESCETFTHLPG